MGGEMIKVIKGKRNLIVQTNEPYLIEWFDKVTEFGAEITDFLNDKHNCELTEEYRSAQYDFYDEYWHNHWKRDSKGRFTK